MSLYSVLMKKSYWPYGSQKKLYELAGMKQQNLNEILHRRRGVSYQTALKLQNISYKALKKKINWKEWLTNKYSNHPAFFGDPIIKEEDFEDEIKIFM